MYVEMHMESSAFKYNCIKILLRNASWKYNSIEEKYQLRRYMLILNVVLNIILVENIEDWDFK